MSKPTLDLSHPALDLANVEVGIPGEVLADRGVVISQGAVESGAAHTDHYGNQTKQEEEQAGVPTANIYREGGREGGREMEVKEQQTRDLSRIHLLCLTIESETFMS